MPVDSDSNALCAPPSGVSPAFDVSKTADSSEWMRNPPQPSGSALNSLYYGDNLDSLRKSVGDESVDFCYIDPPFNSKRTYNQIYNRIGVEDRAQAQAFIDTWTWNDEANIGLEEILTNRQGRFAVQTIELIKGLSNVLGKDSLLAYLVSMTLRLSEIQRVLKPTGSFYFHCDPTVSHYLKLVTDGVFCSHGGEFQNEIVWAYQTGGASKQRFARKHDILLFYTKSDNFTFNSDDIREPRTEKSLQRAKNPNGARISATDTDKLPTDVFQIQALNPMAKERLGYPTQKPEALLERIIKASTNRNDVVLDAYCGCGTSVAIAQRLDRHWIGMDITFQSVSLVLKRLEDSFGKSVAEAVRLSGIPRDMESASALAHKKDDRLRKEFEKWAVLTYTLNRAAINEKKGADAGIDGTAYFLTGPTETEKMVFQVKSGKVSRGDIAKLNSDRQREKAELATLITLEDPTSAMRLEANAAGCYKHPFTGRVFPVIEMVTVREMVEGAVRLGLPLSLEALKSASKQPPKSEQGNLWKDREFGD